MSSQKFYFNKEEATIEGVIAFSKIAYELGWAMTDVFVDDKFMERQAYWDSVVFYIDPEYGQTVCFALEEFAVLEKAEKVTPAFAMEYVAKNPYFILEPKKKNTAKVPKEKPLKATFKRKGRVLLNREQISLSELSNIEEQCKENL